MTVSVSPLPFDFRAFLELAHWFPLFIWSSCSLSRLDLFVRLISTIFRPDR